MSRQTNDFALLTEISPKSSLSETYRTLRTNTHYSDTDGSPRTICVASCVQGEGRTITAANLAITYAQEGKKTLLVDADLRNPVLHKVFGTNNGSGLTQYLRTANPLQSFVVSTYIDHLFLLPSGPTPKNPSELLSSARMDELMNGLFEEYEVIIFDTPPVLLVTDAQIVAAKSDGVLLVIGAGKVKRDAAVKAKKLLEHVQANILGVVFNGKKTPSTELMYKRYKAAAE
ncbi:CpsD/CapB family tyrosine-protein kinase [Cohnella cholangitidis]|uniref:non-specific protein-tyrosine kinase n=1 Tax=Cohnella cholangitidis TaxID=2598458 RepID=A0A7G5C1Y9_9BACL|nr:CpsD/CapB family tyrosine-protein kinase [Cohnella cholangitidis]QMV43223.1 CpsD/CapB family tyrosine-protein kinase [Cohnella cholangitidis]